MRDSTTYQAILEEGEAAGQVQGREEGRAAEARNALLYLGTRRFGPPAAATEQAFSAVHDPDLLDSWLRRILDAESWDDLLASP